MQHVSSVQVHIKRTGILLLQILFLHTYLILTQFKLFRLLLLLELYTLLSVTSLTQATQTIHMPFPHRDTH